MLKKFLMAVVMAAAVPALGLGAAPHAQADNDPAGACRAWEKAVAANHSGTVTYGYDQIIAPLVIRLTDDIPTTQRDAQARDRDRLKDDQVRLAALVEERQRQQSAFERDMEAEGARAINLSKQVDRYFDRNCPQHSPVVKKALQSLPMLVPPEFY